MRMPALLPFVLLLGSAPGQVDALRAFLAKDSKAPPGAALDPHLQTLDDLLDDPDPKLRDDLAYTLLARWIVQDGAVPPEKMLQLLDRWQPRLGAPGNDDDDVLRRSFAALSTALLVARDNQQAFLDKKRFDKLLTATLHYLKAERDERGYDERLGWIHSTAHCADLIKFLARSRHLEATQQHQVLAAIRTKLFSVRRTFAAGEDGRLVRPVLALIDRDDFDADAFATWTRALLKPPTFASQSHRIAFRQNRRHVVTGLFTQLVLDRDPSPGRKQALAATRLLLGG